MGEDAFSDGEIDAALLSSSAEEIQMLAHAASVDLTILERWLSHKNSELLAQRRGAPEPPKSAFRYFQAVVVAHVTSSNRCANNIEIAQILTEMWSSMPDADRRSFE